MEVLPLCRPLHRTPQAAHRQDGGPLQAWPLVLLSRASVLTLELRLFLNISRGSGSQKCFYLWACQKVRIEGQGLGVQWTGNPGAQAWSWPCFHSLASFNSFSQHMQFTLWYPAHVDFGGDNPPEFRIYNRANRHGSKE